MLESLRPDPTFYPSPRLAMEGEAERYTYTVLLSPDGSRPDALAVVDTDRSSATFGRMLYRLDMPNTGDEFHHFGWNACSSALSPMSGHAFLKRRYLIIPGIRSSRLYVIDTQPDPRHPTIAKIIEPEEVLRRTGYSRPHTVHCGPEGIYISTLGGAAPDGSGLPGVFVMDCESFEILGKWEIERGPQKLHYDFWWNLPRDYMVSSEWGLPPQFENGIVAEDLLANKYGHALHFWDLRARKHVQTIDLGANHQMALEVRPAHDPVREYGFVGVVVDTTNLEGSIWTWNREPSGKFVARKTATIPPEPADAPLLPPLLRGFGAVPPLISDIDLSLDDRFLYVACWGTGELRQYDVSDPMQPRLSGSVRIGGIARHTTHPSGRAFGGGPQMTEISRDGKRVYFTNSLYSTWDAQFYPDGVPGVQVMCHVDASGGLRLDSEFCVEFGPEYGAHQVRLQGGDCSTDSFCYSSA